MGISKKVKVLVVEDSAFYREALIRGLSRDLGIEVVGSAKDPFEARDKIIDLLPDVLTLDVEMPRMNGIEFLRKLMPQYPLPVVVVSSISSSVFDALNAGAVDFISKPEGSLGEGGFNRFMNELIVKIKIAAVAKIGAVKVNSSTECVRAKLSPGEKYPIIAIGASTGGTEATLEILKCFPKDMPGVLVVQHMPAVFTRMYAERIDRLCAMEVKEAKDGDMIERGLVLIAPGDFQMRVVKHSQGYRVKVEAGEKVSGHCPSVDVLFQSCAQTLGANAIGVILTGMGSDGAKGLLEMKKKGAYTIGQDEKSSVVYGMPMVAFHIGAVSAQVSLEKISDKVIEYLQKR